MRLRKRTRTIVAMLLVLCVVIVAVLNAQTPANMPSHPAEKTAEQTANKPMPVGSVDQPTEASACDTPTSQAAQPHTEVTQPSESSQASGPGSSLADPSATSGATEAPAATSAPEAASAPEADEDASPTREEIQRQAAAAIPHVEQPTVDPNAECEPGVVLVSVRKGTTAEQFSQAMAAADIASVKYDGVEAVTDDLLKATLAPNATIDDAIYELESTGVAQGAQPNYVYQIAEEQVPALDETEPAPVGATARGEGEPAPVDATAQGEGKAAHATDAGAPQMSDESISAAEEDAAGTQSSSSSAIEAQSTSPTAARNALNDTYANKQWDLDSIDALDAWEFPPLKNAASTVGVGILDNGFNDYHEDLADNVQSTYNTTTSENAPVSCPPGTPNPDHGNHVAGIVAATSNNEKGIGGVGFNHLKLSLVCLTSESRPSGITTDDVVRGFDYLIAHKDQYNIRVANMSIGVRVDSLPTNDAILKKIDEAYDAGIVTVASAGNKTGSAIPPYINYPSDYATVVSVINLRNTNSDDPKSVDRSDGSNFNATGETSKNISAPGTDIYSTYRNGYEEMSGTSMAAPHVAGVVGLMFAVNPTLSANQAKDLLYNNARDIGTTGWDETFGHGEVNAFFAVRAAANGTIAGPEYLAVGSSATYSLGTSFTGWSFSSSNPSVLAVDEDGHATAASAGIAMVRASSGSSSISRQVTVLGPITGNSLVAKDGSKALSIITPDGCGSLAWEWKSSDESVATVTDKGVVYGHSEGSAIITATLVSDPTVSLSYAVTVYKATESDVYVPVGHEATLNPRIPEGIASPTISWSSTNTQVAAVDSNGKVTASRAGGTVVSCTMEEGDKSATNVWCVYVYGPIEGDARMGVGQSVQLAVAGISNLSQEAQTGWTWSLDAGSSSEVATVSEDGVVTGQKPGTVTVTATKGSGQDQVSFSHDVVVTRASIANAKVTIPRQTYSGKKLTPVPVATFNGTTLVAGTDYDVADNDIVGTGRHTVTIRGKGTYEGIATGVFVVEPLKLKPPKAATGLVYNGSPQVGIAEGAGYTLMGDVTKTDADEYLAFAVVNDKVNTRWEDDSTSYRIEWSIAPRPASDLSVAVPGSYVYNGSAHKPKPTVTWNGKPLKTADGEDFNDYEVSYANNVNAGTATITFTFEEGNFKGTTSATFSIAQAPSSVGTVTAAVVKDSLDPAIVVLARTDSSIPGRLAITETALAYGTNTYHWSFTPTDANHLPSSGTVAVTVTGHEWGEPTYEWDEGDASCTARRVCANNPAHVEAETVVPVRKVTTEPTTEGGGKATLTAEFKNTAFKTQSKEVTLPKLPQSGKVGYSVAMEGDGPFIDTSVPEGLVESLLTDHERELVAGGTDASLVAAVRWLGVDSVPKGDLALLAKDCKDGKVSMGWEAYLSVDLHVRVGNEQRSVTKTDKPIAFTVKLDPEGKEAVSKGLAQAVADGKVDGSVTVRRVHEGAVTKVGSAKRGEVVTFESDRFSTFALGSEVKAGNASGGSGDGQSQSPTQATASQTQTTTSVAGQTTAGTSTKLADTSEPASPHVALSILGLMACVPGFVARRRSTVR